MTVHFCPDCLSPTPVRKQRQDGRCDGCRTHVGKRRNYSNPRRLAPAVKEPFEYLLTEDNPR